MIKLFANYLLSCSGFFFSERPLSNGEGIHSTNTDRSLVVSGKENVAMSLDEDLHSTPPRRLPPIPEDKIHRVNHFF